MKNLTIINTFVLSVLFTFVMYSQELSVPLPASSNMTSYGGEFVNESSGTVTKSIPLYNYTAGNLSMSIGLSYIGNGVKVDQHSNWVGTNWNLEAGGIVSRTINHIPDELAEHRLYFEDIEMLKNSDNTDYTNGIIKGENLTHDLRRDLFSFSFPGYSGAFYLDKTGKPRLLVVDSELKIELVASPSNTAIKNTIVITTPNGIKYYFGGDNASESTSSYMGFLNKTGGAHQLDYEVFPKAITSFYLYKVSHPFGDEIILEYYDDGDKEYLLYQSQYLRHQEQLDSQQSMVKHHIAKLYNRKKLKKIHSVNSDYEVILGSTHLFLPAIEGTYVDQYDDRVLNTIEVNNTKLTKIVKKIDLEYLTTSHRIFLTDIKIKNDISASDYCQVYNMEYRWPESLPARFSRNQNSLGYPMLVSNTGVVSIGGILNPMLGALTKITNPLGGYTTFEYGYTRPNTAPPAPVVTSHLYVYKHDGGARYVDELYIGKIPEGERGIEGVEDINFDVSLSMSEPVAKRKTANLMVEVIRMSDGEKIVLSKRDIYPSSSSASFTTTESSVVIAGLGELSANARFTGFWGPNGNDEAFKLRLTLTNIGQPYPQGILKINNITTPRTIEPDPNKQGLRIVKVANYAENGALPLVKSYYYGKIKGLLQNQDDQDDQDDLQSSVDLSQDIQYGALFNAFSCSGIGELYTFVNLDNDPYGHYVTGPNNQVLYRYVTVYTDDSFKGGAIEKTFRIEKDDKAKIEYEVEEVTGNTSFNLGSFVNNKGILNGKLLKETAYKKVGDNDLRKLSETVYEYNTESIHEISNLILTNIQPKCINNSTVRLGIANYYNESYDFDLTTIKRRTFTGDLPKPSETGTFIEEVEEIEYGTLQGLPTEVTTSSSINSDKTIVKNYYLTPADINAINTSTNPVTPLETAAYNALINQYRLSGPIQTETYIKKGTAPEKLRATQRTIYKDFNGNGLVLPATDKASIMNFSLENGTTIHQYDANGYVLESSNEHGIKTAVIYGYKDKKLIAELVDVSYAAIPTAIITNLHNKANNVTNAATMQELKVALDALRASFPDANITTYVYNEIGQLDSTKDVRGNEIKYEYDDCFQLKRVKDRDGNILKEYEHHYKN